MTSWQSCINNRNYGKQQLLKRHDRVNGTRFAFLRKTTIKREKRGSNCFQTSNNTQHNTVMFETKKIYTMNSMIKFTGFLFWDEEVGEPKHGSGVNDPTAEVRFSDLWEVEICRTEYWRRKMAGAWEKTEV